MRLNKVKIENYKCILNSNEFQIGDTTCLVGKNESGKSAILESLYKLNPVENEFSKYDPLKEFPRSFLTDYEAEVKNGKRNVANILTTYWDIEDVEYEELKNIYFDGSILSRQVIITKGYDNCKYITLGLSFSNYRDNILKKHSIAKIKYKDVFEAVDLKTLKNKLKNIEDKEDNVINVEKELQSVFGDKKFEDVAKNILLKYLPKFLLFSDYYIMPGTVSMSEFKKRENESRLEIKDRVFDALLKMADTSAKDIDSIDKFDRLDAKLQATSSKLTRDIFSYWSQNKNNLSVEFRFDNARPGDPAPFNSGYVFRTTIMNKNHGVKINFDERSSGFVWFFSFLVWFSQIKSNYGDKLIILLDEPALNLHIKAQSDLLRYFDEKLKPNHQLIYTTHSPFMIEPNNLTNTKIVEDVIKDTEIIGTKVKDDIYAVDKDTLFPLQAAVGYDITQTLFIGKNSLLVEGPSDLIYLKWISEILKKMKKEYLNNMWVITPVGGIDKISAFISLFSGNNLNVAVLTDYHSGDKTKIEKLKSLKILEESRIITSDMYLDKKESDIEDLLGKDFFTGLVNKTYSLTGKRVIKITDEEFNNTRINELINLKLPSDIENCEHLTPALYLLEHSSEFETEFRAQGDAIEIFEKIFKTLNSFFKK